MSNEQGSFQYPNLLGPGSLSITSGPSQELPSHEQDGITRTQGVTHRANIETGEVLSDGGVIRFQHDSAGERRALAESGADIMSTLKSNSRPGEPLNPRKATILYQGFELDLASAAHLNLVREDGPGRWVSTSAAAPQAPHQASVLGQQQQAPAAAPQGEARQEIPFLPHGEALIHEIESNVEAGFLPSVMQKAISGDFEAAAAASNLPSSEQAMLAAQLREVANVMRGHLHHATSKIGVDAEDFLLWASQNKPEQLKSAMTQHLATRSTQYYAPLLASYRRNTMPSTEALNAAGLQTRMGKEGEETFVPAMKQWIPSKVLARAGLLG
jgi:hypothetical protein